jgi:hypothetical protein
MQQSQTQIRGTQSLLVAAREAANYNEPWTKRVAERHEVTAENVTERVSPRYVSLIIDQAKRIDPKDAKISTLFSADAYDILCRASASPFWFWRIIAQAAETSNTLPLSAADINEAIKEVGYRWYIGSSLGRKLMERSSLPNLQFQDRETLVSSCRGSVRPTTSPMRRPLWKSIRFSCAKVGTLGAVCVL